jgi:hypothetical protein
MNKNQRDEQRQQDDIALIRGLIWVGIAIVFELLLLLVNKYYINIYTTAESVAMAYAVLNVMKAARIAGLAAAVACGAWAVLKFKKNEECYIPVLLMLVCGILVFTSHIVLNFQGSGVRMLYMLVPALAALALVYYLYQKDFFCCAAVSGMGVVALWLIRHGANSMYTVYAFLLLMGLVLVLGAVVLGGVRQTNGVLSVMGRKLQILPEDANYVILLATAVVNIMVVAGAMLMGGTLAYYLLYVMIAYLFALLVFYTVKMM